MVFSSSSFGWAKERMLAAGGTARARRSASGGEPAAARRFKSASETKISDLLSKVFDF